MESAITCIEILAATEVILSLSSFTLVFFRLARIPPTNNLVVDLFCGGRLNRLEREIATTPTLEQQPPQRTKKKAGREKKAKLVDRSGNRGDAKDRVGSSA